MNQRWHHTAMNQDRQLYCHESKISLLSLSTNRMLIRPTTAATPAADPTDYLLLRLQLLQPIDHLLLRLQLTGASTVLLRDN